MTAHNEVSQPEDRRPLEEQVREFLDLVDQAIDGITDEEIERERRRIFRAAGRDPDQPLPAKGTPTLDLSGSTDAKDRRRKAHRRGKKVAQPAQASGESARRLDGRPPRRAGRPTGRTMVSRNRERVLAHLDAVIRDGEEGRPGVTMIRGEPGVGKTTLLDRFAERADGAQVTVVRGGAGEVDRTAPLSTIRSALATCAPIREEIDGIRTENPVAYANRVAEVLEAHAGDRLVVIIDDAHLVDEASATALRQLVSFSSPVQWLLACRPAERTPGAEMVAWMREHGGREIDLLGLDRAAVVSLSTELLGNHPDPGLRAALTEGDGNPLAIEELLEGLRAAGRLKWTDNGYRVTGGDVPRRFVDAIRLRLAKVDEAARRVLEAGSVLARPFTVEAASALIGAAAADAIRAAVDAKLLRVDGHEFAFRHDLIRETVYDLIDESRRRSLHRAAVDLILAEGRPDAEAAEHVMRGDLRGDRAIGLLRRAARALINVAPATAAGYLASARAMLPEDSARWSQVWVESVHTLILANRPADARELGAQALRRRLTPAAEAEVLLELAWSLRQEGLNDAVLRYARRARDAEQAPDSVKARAYAVEAHTLVYLGSIEDARRAGIEALRLGRGHAGAQVSGNTALSLVARREGRFGVSLEHARIAVDTADWIADESMRRHPRIWLGAALVALDRMAEADPVYLQVGQDADRLGTMWVLPLWHFEQATMLHAQGRLDDAVAVAETGLVVADEIGIRQMSVPLLGLLAVIAVEGGRLAEAGKHLARQRRLMRRDGILVSPYLVAWPRAALQEAQDDPAAALASLGPIFGGLPDNDFLLFAHDPGCAPALVRIALAAGDQGRADLAVAAARVLADRNPGTGSVQGAALHAEGLARRDFEALGAALAQLRGGPRPLMLAGALADLAVMEHRAGREAPANEHRDEAVAIYRDCVAPGAVARLARRLDIAAPAEEAGPAGLDALTPTEREVLRLLAGGGTRGRIGDSLRTSSYTVDTLLRHIYRKLGVRSPIELARIVETEVER
jgi:ATP/maltotriose-dependent transcriptional regulator MalT